MAVAANVGYLKQVQSLETALCGAWLSPRGLKQAPQELFGLFPFALFWASRAGLKQSDGSAGQDGLKPNVPPAGRVGCMSV